MGVLVSVQSLGCCGFGKNFASASFFVVKPLNFSPFLVIYKTYTWVGKVFWARDSIVPPKYHSAYA